MSSATAKPARLALGPPKAWAALAALGAFTLSVGGSLGTAFTTGGVVRPVRSLIARAPTLPAPADAGAGDAERGAYLAEIFVCKECHTLRQPGTEDLDPSRAFGGGIPFEGPWGVVHSANVTRVARGMPPAVLEATIRGRMTTKFQMPTDLYARMAKQDMRDLIAYLRALRPVASPPNPNRLTPTWPAPPPVPAAASIPERAPAGPSIERGEYLSRMSICKDCHSPRQASSVTGYDEGICSPAQALRFADRAGAYAFHRTSRRIWRPASARGTKTTSCACCAPAFVQTGPR